MLKSEKYLYFDFLSKSGENNLIIDPTQIKYFSSLLEMLCELAQCLVDGYRLRAIADFGLVGIMDVTRRNEAYLEKVRFQAPISQINFLGEMASMHRMAGNDNAGAISVKFCLMRKFGVNRDEFSIGLHMKMEDLIAALKLREETGMSFLQIVRETAIGEELVAGLV